MKKFLFSLFALVMFSTVSLTAQITEGIITLEIMDVKTEGDQTAMMAGMLKGAETKLHFSGSKSYNELSMMGGMIMMKTYLNTDTKSQDMLMDAMGSKIWVKSTLDDAAKKEATDARLKDMKIEQVKTDTKEILGFKAHRVNITIPDGKGSSMTMTCYVTNELDVKNNGGLPMMESIDFGGYPLEITVNGQGMDITLVATNFEKKVDSALLTPNTEGYTKMTAEEFAQMGGGMGF